MLCLPICTYVRTCKNKYFFSYSNKKQHIKFSYPPTSFHFLFLMTFRISPFSFALILSLYYIYTLVIP